MIARKAKIKNEWFVGGITDENGKEQQQLISAFYQRKKNLKLLFMKTEKNADWKIFTIDYKINKQKVSPYYSKKTDSKRRYCNKY